MFSYFFKKKPVCTYQVSFCWKGQKPNGNQLRQKGKQIAFSWLWLDSGMSGQSPSNSIVNALILSPSLSSPSLQDLFHCAYGVSLCSGEDGFLQPSPTLPMGREKKACSFCLLPPSMRESCSLSGRGSWFPKFHPWSSGIKITRERVRDSWSCPQLTGSEPMGAGTHQTMLYFKKPSRSSWHPPNSVNCGSNISSMTEVRVRCLAKARPLSPSSKEGVLKVEGRISSPREMGILDGETACAYLWVEHVTTAASTHQGRRPGKPCAETHLTWGVL